MNRGVFRSAGRGFSELDSVLASRSETSSDKLGLASASPVLTHSPTSSPAPELTGVAEMPSSVPAVQESLVSLDSD